MGLDADAYQVEGVPTATAATRHHRQEGLHRDLQIRRHTTDSQERADGRGLDVGGLAFNIIENFSTTFISQSFLAKKKYRKFLEVAGTRKVEKNVSDPIFVLFSLAFLFARVEQLALG